MIDNTSIQNVHHFTSGKISRSNVKRKKKSCENFDFEGL